MEIQLLGLEFFAYHGVYPIEREQGNTFTMDIKVRIQYPYSDSTDDILQTVDYEKLYNIASEIMKQPVNLLETLALAVLDKIFSEFPQAQWTEIAVSKLNPPISGKCRESRVVIQRNRFSNA